MDIHELLSLLGHGTLDSLYMIIICTVVLCYSLMRTGTFSRSLFQAH